MCFIVHKKHNKVKTANRDISCYKMLITRKVKVVDGVLIDGLASPYFGMVWDFKSQTYFTVKTLGVREITPTWSRETNVSWVENESIVTTGLHSYSNKDKLKELTTPLATHIPTFVKFIIPKGTKYYYNPKQKEYVSMGLKFVSIMKNT